MPLMSWDAFCERHGRRFLIEARLAAGAPEGWLDSLPKFIGSMSLEGDFSLCRGREGLRAAFEREADATHVVRALGARRVGAGDEWAGHWRLVLDWAGAEKDTWRAAAVVHSPARLLRPKRRHWPRLLMLGLAH